MVLNQEYMEDITISHEKSISVTIWLKAVVHIT